MDIPNCLFLAKNLVYDPCKFDFFDLKIDKESIEYDACSFKLNGKSILHRTAKITPTKIGQFVTIWKRNSNGQTEPFNSSDVFDLIIISAKNQNLFGQFIFPKFILLDKGIISDSNKQGKRGIRVYPPWDITTSKQAQTTQQWQLNYFIEISDSEINLEKIKNLIKIK
ncbi:MAG: MepB family protein [Pedobacter sp.]|jgi:hypothetical protein|uniref:MepB family protein n=1 Tax=Pedobacter sp. TaxID=1411316 RepID=UPI003566A662